MTEVEDGRRPSSGSWRESLARYDSAHTITGTAPAELNELDLIAGVVDAAEPQWAEQQRRFGLPTSDEVPFEHLVLALDQIPGLHQRLDSYERRLLEAARDRGESWASLAARLGRGSEQAMQQRYRRLGGTRRWRAATRTTRAADLQLLRGALDAASATHLNTVAWIRGQLDLRRAIATVLAGDALGAKEVQAATDCSDYTLVLARDTDAGSDMQLDLGTADSLRIALAVENFLDERWWQESTTSTFASPERHPDTPTPVRAWNAHDETVRERYLAEADRQLALLPPPYRHPWRHGWRGWYRLLAHGTVIAVPDNTSPGYWLLHEATDGGKGMGEKVGEEMSASLADLAEAGLIILRPNGVPLTRDDFTKPQTGR
jgi:hypothetical protein